MDDEVRERTVDRELMARARAARGTATWRRDLALLLELGAILVAVAVGAAVLVGGPMPSGTLVLAALAAPIVARPLRRGTARERRGGGDVRSAVVRRALLEPGRWEVEANDGQHHQVLITVARQRLAGLAVGDAVVIRRWPDGRARLERCLGRPATPWS